MLVKINLLNAQQPGEGFETNPELRTALMTMHKVFTVVGKK